MPNHNIQQHNPDCFFDLNICYCDELKAVDERLQIVVEAPRGDAPDVVTLSHGNTPSRTPLSDEALLGSTLGSDSYDP